MPYTWDGYPRNSGGAIPRSSDCLGIELDRIDREMDQISRELHSTREFSPALREPLVKKFRELRNERVRIVEKIRVRREIEAVESGLEKVESEIAEVDKLIEYCQGYPTRYDDPLVRRVRKLELARDSYKIRLEELRK